MARLQIIVEGQTEERVVKDVIAPHLWDHQVWARPVLVSTSASTAGGGTQYARWQLDVTLAMKSRPGEWVTTMVDLYRLPTGFPAPASTPPPGPDRVGAIEAAFDADLRGVLGDVFPWRFIPYVQRHELEALLFADPAVTADVIRPGDEAYARSLAAARASHDTPEDINDGPDTAPSKRLGGVYRKTRHAPAILNRVGLGATRQTCPRFDAWLTKLEALGTP